MTTYFVNSNGGAPSSPYANWTDAAAKVEDAITAGAGAADIIKVHTGTTPHAESVASAITWNGPTGAPLVIIGVDKDNSDAYTIATTDIITTTGANNINITGTFAIYGIWFTCGNDLTMATTEREETIYGQGCKFTLAGTTGEDFIFPMVSRFRDCTWICGSASKIKPDADGSQVELINPTITGSASTGLFEATDYLNLQVIGGDFSGVAVDLAAPQTGKFSFIGCVKHATADLVNPAQFIYEAIEDQTDTVGGNDQWRRFMQQGSDRGTITLSGTIYRDAGATYDGTNEYSLAFAAGSVQHIDLPTYSPWNSVYVTSGDAQNIRVYFAATTSQNDDDIWIEVEYLGATANTLKTVASNRMATILATPAAHTTASGEAWTGISETPTGGQYMTLSSTIDIKKSGMLRWRAGYAGSATIYVCTAAEMV